MRLPSRSEEHTSELQSPCNLGCRLLLEKKKLAEESVFEFPESMTITKIPTGIELDSKYFYYPSAYALNRNLVSPSRAYRTKFSSPICTQQDFEEMKEANRAMRADLNGQILIGAR